MPFTFALSINKFIFKLLCLWICRCHCCDLSFDFLIPFFIREWFLTEQIWGNVKLQSQTFTFCVRTLLLLGVTLIADNRLRVQTVKKILSILMLHSFISKYRLHLSRCSSGRSSCTVPICISEFRTLQWQTSILNEREADLLLLVVFSWQDS